MHPGIILLIGGLGSLLARKKYKFFIALISGLAALVIIPTLNPGAYWSFSYLDFELLLFRVDGPAQIMGVVLTLAALGALLFARLSAGSKFYLLAPLYAGSSLMVVFAGDLLTFFVFWELMTISSFFLILNSRQRRTKITGIYYFLMHMVGGLSLLGAVMVHYGETGHLMLAPLQAGQPWLILALGIKMAFIGVHTWLPRTYSRVPYHISVFLAIFTTKIGIYGVFRLLEPHNFLIWGGGCSALLGVILALRANKLRTILCYSIITKLGYVLVTMGSGSWISRMGGLMYLTNHIIYKTLLFMISGIIIYATGKEKLDQLGGLAGKMPFTMVCTLLASAAAAGLPLTGSYISKIILKEGLTSGPYILLTLIEVGTILVFLKVFYSVFLKKQKRNTVFRKKPPLSLQAPLLILVSVIFIPGLRPKPVFNLMELEETVLELSFFQPYFLWSSLQPVLIAGLLFVAGYFVGSRDFLGLEPGFQHRKYLNFDPYLQSKKYYLLVGEKFSYWHNGDLSRYLFWAFNILLFIWISLLWR